VKARVKKELSQQLFGDPVPVLNHQVREIARGRSDGEILRHASGSEIERATVAEVQQELKRWHCPANAVLSIVGDFGKVDMRTLVEKQFGSIPAGAPRPEPAVAPLKPVTRSMRRDGAPAGSLGILAPALADTSHAQQARLRPLESNPHCRATRNRATLLRDARDHNLRKIAPK